MPDPSFPDGSSLLRVADPPGSDADRMRAGRLRRPSIGADPNTAQTDSPAGASVNVDVPFVTGGGEPSPSSNLKDATVTLPPGMGLNPAAANGLEACTDAQFGKGTRNPVACPDASKIGTVSIQTPPLPPDSLAGNVYLGQPLSGDPASGQEFRIFVDAESSPLRDLGSPDRQRQRRPPDRPAHHDLRRQPPGPVQLLPAPLRRRAEGAADQPADLRPAHDRGGADAWSGNPAATPVGGLQPHRRARRRRLRENARRPPLRAELRRRQPQQAGRRLHRLHREPDAPGRRPGGQGRQRRPAARAGRQAGRRRLLPGGGHRRRRGEHRRRREEPTRAVPSRASSARSESTRAPAPSPSTSRAGPTSPAPTRARRSASPSSRRRSPARTTSAPSWCAWRSASTPTPRQVHAVSDPIPDVFGGVKLDLRSIAVHVSRKQFTLNPTNCDPKAVDGTLFGGGANPTDPAAFFPDPVSTPFQATGCEALPFGPKLYLRLFGHRKDFRRNGHPRLRAVLVARDGDANISRRRHDPPAGRSCSTRATSARSARGTSSPPTPVPQDSVYGYATRLLAAARPAAQRPGLPACPETHALPDLVAALHGQVDVNLVGRTDTTPQGSAPQHLRLGPRRAGLQVRPLAAGRCARASWCPPPTSAPSPSSVWREISAPKRQDGEASVQSCVSRAQSAPAVPTQTSQAQPPAPLTRAARSVPSPLRGASPGWCRSVASLPARCRRPSPWSSSPGTAARSWRGPCPRCWRSSARATS